MEPYKDYSHNLPLIFVKFDMFPPLQFSAKNNTILRGLLKKKMLTNLQSNYNNILDVSLLIYLVKF